MTTTFVWKDGRRETYPWDVCWGSSGTGFFKCTRFQRLRFLPPEEDPEGRWAGSGEYIEDDWQPPNPHDLWRISKPKTKAEVFHTPCDECRRRYL